MIELLQMLINAGYYVWFEPGWFNPETKEREPGGCSVCIQSERARMVGPRGEEWRAYAETPEQALLDAAQEMTEALRPAHDIYSRLTALAENRR